MMSDGNFKRAALVMVLVLLACPGLIAQQKPSPTGEIIGKRIVFTDGATLDVDDTWKQGDTIWYRVHGTSQSTSRAVRTIENRYKEDTAPSTTTPKKPVETKRAPVV